MKQSITRRFGDNGEKLIEILGDIAEGRTTTIVQRVGKSGEITEIDVRPTIGERKEAASELLAHLHGRPATMQINTNIDLPAEDISDAELKAHVAEIVVRLAGAHLAPALAARQDAIDVNFKALPLALPEPVPLPAPEPKRG